MRVSARADYALRACAELAVAGDERLKRDELSSRQGIPIQYLESVLLQLKHAGILQSHRGAAGGFRLARHPSEISLADVIRAVDGPMADVRGDRPEEVEYPGPQRASRTSGSRSVQACAASWRARRSQDLVEGTLSPEIERLLGAPDAWISLGRVRGPTHFGTATRGKRTASEG